MANYKDEAIAVGHVFIDPASCGSTVSYRVYKESWDDANKKKVSETHSTVVLTDCYKRIEWSFEDDQNSLDKINAAIAKLQEFKKVLTDVVREKYKADKAEKAR